MKFDELDKRMRVFETANDHCVIPGIYIVARLDGRTVAFAAHRLWRPAEAVEDARQAGREGDPGLLRGSGLDTAAVTFAVDPRIRRLGLGTLLLERTLVSAARHGIERLVGLAHRESRALPELFRRGGETEVARRGLERSEPLQGRQTCGHRPMD